MCGRPPRRGLGQKAAAERRGWAASLERLHATMFHSSTFLSPPKVASTSQSPSSANPAVVLAEKRRLRKAAQSSFLRHHCCRSRGGELRLHGKGRSGLGLGQGRNTERLGLGLSLLLQLGGLLQRLGADGPTLLQGLVAAGLQFAHSLLRALALLLGLLSELVATLLLGLLRELHGRRTLPLRGGLGLPLCRGLQACLLLHLRLGSSSHCLRLLPQTLGGFLELSLAGLGLGGPSTLLVALPAELVDEPAQNLLSLRRRLFLDIAVVVELASRRFLVDLRCGPLGLLLCLVLVLVVLRVRGGQLVQGGEPIDLEDQPLVLHIPKRVHLLVAVQGQQGGKLKGRG
mmetsp:Transcript_97168/g.313288  ORF Transcript_97168/g.313288 Transcript_97168/m.313288 type:complete len:344 (-) Transcript_97168:493-1524(-)